MSMLESNIDLDTTSTSGTSSTTTSASETGKVSVDDAVVRGPAWIYGDQDGGAGSVGTVTAVQVSQPPDNCLLVDRLIYCTTRIGYYMCYNFPSYFWLF
jgi:hypothetical protein